jgi:hypothetical protein
VAGAGAQAAVALSAVARTSALARPLELPYQPHALHGQDVNWLEKNCYVDLWIELLHALRLDPMACLGFTLAIDFEGDQWTFFKPSHDELQALYGIEVRELAVWRPLHEHAIEHLGSGRWLCPEVDAYWLPDASGTDYRRQHVKTMIALNDIDLQRQRLGYFHNAGYYTLEGQDFQALLQAWSGDLPPYAELVRLDRVVRRDAAELRTLARPLLRRHLGRRPADNPVLRFRDRLGSDWPALQVAGIDTYHRWAFNGIRQFGAAFELAAMHLRWLDDSAHREATNAFTQIAVQSKALILKAARAASLGRALDATALIEQMAFAWGRGMAALEA